MKKFFRVSKLDVLAHGPIFFRLLAGVFILNLTAGTRPSVAQTPTTPESQQPDLSAKGGGSIGVGGGGDIFKLPNGKMVFIDLAEREPFLPKQLDVYPELSSQLDKLKPTLPGVIRSLFDSLNGKGVLWFFSHVPLKEIDDEDPIKSPVSIDQFLTKKQAAIFNGAEIFIDKNIFNSLTPQNQKYLLIHEALRASFFDDNNFSPKSPSLRRLTSLLMTPYPEKIDPEIYWLNVMKVFLECFEINTSHLDIRNWPDALEPKAYLTKVRGLSRNRLFSSFVKIPLKEIPSSIEASKMFEAAFFYADFLEVFQNKGKSDSLFSKALGLDLESLFKDATRDDPHLKTYVRNLTPEKRFHLIERMTPPISPKLLKEFFIEDVFANYDFSFFPIQILNSNRRSATTYKTHEFRIHFGVTRVRIRDQISLRTLAFVINLDKQTVSVFQIGQEDSLKINQDPSKPKSLVGDLLDKIESQKPDHGLADGEFHKIKTTPDGRTGNWELVGASNLTLDFEEAPDSPIPFIRGALQLSLLREPDFLSRSNLSETEEKIFHSKALNNAKEIEFILYPESLQILSSMRGNYQFYGEWAGIPGTSQKIYPPFNVLNKK